MTKFELFDLIANGENSQVEFARDGIAPEKLAKKIVALANYRGGHILLGVENDGSVSGIQRENIENWLNDSVFEQFVYPTVIPSYEEVHVGEGRRVAVVTLGGQVNKPYVVRERGREHIYIRVGSTSRSATREQQAQLFASGGLLREDSLPVPRSALTDLCLERLSDYLLSIVGDEAIPESSENWNRRLRQLGFMTEPGIGGTPACTIAGLVLFGRSPRRLLKNAGVRWVVYQGKDKNSKTLDDRLLDGPLVPLRDNSPEGGNRIIEDGLLEKLFEEMRLYVSDKSTQSHDSMQSEGRWKYPLEPLRESIVNAFAHRDWTRYDEIKVMRCAESLSVLSPGALPYSMTVEKMIRGQRSSRNALIVDVLRDYGYMDARGIGVRNKIIPQLLADNGSEPEFEVTRDCLKTVMRQCFELNECRE